MFAVAVSPDQRDRSELIERFLEIAGFGEADAQFDIDPAAPESARNWRKYVADSMEDEMSGIIEAEKLKAEPPAASCARRSRSAACRRRARR